MRRLNEASRDLTLALFGALPEEVERRWKSGDVAAFTHYLAMHANDEVRSLVARDYDRVPRLRQKVDAYIALFEELLEVVSGLPNGDELVDTSLASDSGRLYLQLARAIGRMED